MEHNTTNEDCQACVKQWSGTDHFIKDWKYQCSLCNKNICDDHKSRCEMDGCSRLTCDDCFGSCERCDRSACFACEKTDEALGIPLCRDCIEKEIHEVFTCENWSKEAVQDARRRFPGIKIDIEDRTIDLPEPFLDSPKGQKRSQEDQDGEPEPKEEHAEEPEELPWTPEDDERNATSTATLRWMATHFVKLQQQGNCGCQHHKDIVRQWLRLKQKDPSGIWSGPKHTEWQQCLRLVQLKRAGQYKKSDQSRRQRATPYSRPSAQKDDKKLQSINNDRSALRASISAMTQAINRINNGQLQPIQDEMKELHKQFLEYKKQYEEKWGQLADQEQKIKGGRNQMMAKRKQYREQLKRINAQRTARYKEIKQGSQ